MRIVAFVCSLLFFSCYRPHVRTIQQAHETTVLIGGLCAEYAGAMGSGVIVGYNTVLTAAHVVDEECIYFISVEGREEVFPVEVLHQDKKLDIAVLRTVERLPHTSLETAAVRAGQTVCSYSAIPTRTRKCGRVQYYRKEPPGDVEFDVVAEPGNSGSGVYDMNGRLVGIVTHLRVCRATGQICAGRFTSLHGTKYSF